MWKPLRKMSTIKVCLTAIFLIATHWAFAQGSSCACQDNINVSLNDDCEYLLTISNVQAGNCGDDTYIIVDDGTPANRGLINCPGKFTYGVFRGEEMICWGHVTAEDIGGPIPYDTITQHEVLECHLINEVLNKSASIKPDNKFYVGEILFRDNCDDCGCEVNRTFSDHIQYKDCEETVRTGVKAEIVRTWTAIDCNGHRSEATQVFSFVRPSLDTLNLVTDTVYQTCSPESAFILTRYPYWIDAFGDKISLNDIDCDYAATIDSRKFSVCDDGSYKQENYVRVFDWCAGGAVYVDTFTIKVGDFAAPVFTGNATNVETDQVLEDLQADVDRDSLLKAYYAGKIKSFSTGPIDCTASLSLQLQTLKALLGFEVEDCSTGTLSTTIYAYERETLFGFPINDTSWVHTNYVYSNEIAAGLPPGIYAMELNLADGCKNLSTGLVYFLVEDKIAPVMKCDDQLNVSLTTAFGGLFDQEAYARVDAVDVNEGSFDNCEMGHLKIRRSVVDLESCADFFIRNGYDSNEDGQIDENDWYDEDGNHIYDPSTEYKWEYIDGIWYTPWRDFAEFFCCDVDQSVVVQLGGWDRARHPLTGAPQPNLNYCWQTTLIEDSTVPQLTSLPTAYIQCTDPLLNELTTGPLEGRVLDEVRATFGETTPFGIFCGSISMTESIEDYRDLCGFGRINRVIEVEKRTELKGTKVATIIQPIYITKVFDYNICFPADVSFYCTDGIEGVPGVEIESEACDLFAINYSEERFEVSGDSEACYKILRTYQVMNWCEYDGNAPPVIVGRDWDGWNGCDITGENYEYNINPLHPDGDDQPGDEGICIIVDRNFQDTLRDVVYYDRNTNPFDTIPNHPATDSLEGYWWKVVSGSTDPNAPAYGSGGYGCSNIGVWDNDINDNGSNDDDDFRYGSNGFWQYTQHIKVTDGVPPTLSISAPDTIFANDPLDCEASFELKIEALDNCSEEIRFEVLIDLENLGFLQDQSDKITGASFQDRLPIGGHRIVVRAYDICGNMVSTEHQITVIDGVAPSPICLPGLIVELMPVAGGGGAVDVWATDFVASPIGDCTGQGPTLAPVNSGILQPVIMDYSVNKIGDTAYRYSMGIQLTCDNLGMLVPVEVHAWDNAGNHNYCNTFVEVQDNNGFCSGESGAGRVAGAIRTEGNIEVENVEIELSGGKNQRLATNALGNFSFEYLVEGYDYTIVPTLDENPMNGISTFDLVLMSQHILGVKRFTSPYKTIAADVNRSGGVTTLDLIQLRKLILNLEVTFPSNTSWRFVKADFKFPDPTNPWVTPFPEISNMNNLQGTAEVNFVAIKIGDVNYSARPNSLFEPEPRSTVGTLILEADNINMQAGEEYDIPFYANMDNIAGYQFTLELPKAIGDFLTVDPILTREENFGLFKEEGKLTSAFVNVDDPGGRQHLFNLHLKAYADVKLSDHLKITSSITESEAYDFAYNTLGLALELQETILEYEANTLFANFPNPFREKTMINFYLEQASHVEIQIQDALGRTVKVIQDDFTAGYHQLPILATELGESGIYYYQIKTANEFEANQQMIVID